MMQIANLRQLSSKDLALLGVSDFAFVKHVPIDGGIVYAIHSADGTQMALMGDRDVAFAAIRQHGMEPVSVH